MLYNCFRKEEVGLVISLLKEVIWNSHLPFKLKRIGRKRFNLRKMVFLCLLKQILGKSFREFHSFLEANKQILEFIELEKVPDFRTLHRVVNQFPDFYLEKLNNKLIEKIKYLDSNFSIDATGFSNSAKLHWNEINQQKTEENIKKRKEFTKLNIVIGNKTRAIYTKKITKGTVHDIKSSSYLLDKLSVQTKIKNFIADSGYLSRQFCDEISELDARPVIKPKSNTIKKPKGSWAWKNMILDYKNKNLGWMKLYHERNNVECAFSVIKRRFGSTIVSLKPENRDIELSIKVLTYNAFAVSKQIFMQNY